MKAFLMKWILPMALRYLAPLLINAFEKASKEIVASARNSVTEKDVPDVMEIARNNIKTELKSRGFDFDEF